MEVICLLNFINRNLSFTCDLTFAHSSAESGLPGLSADVEKDSGNRGSLWDSALLLS